MSTFLHKSHARASLTLSVIVLFVLNMNGNNYNSFPIEEDFFFNVEKVDTIVGPAINNINYTDPSDCGLVDGSITIFASGGTPPLLYSIDGGTSFYANNLFENLAGGSYSLAVVNNDTTCLLVGPSVNLVDPVTPEINSVISMAPSDCGIDDGSIQISASGAGTLEYSINTGLSWTTDSVFSDLPANRYIVFVRNFSGNCQVASMNNPVDLLAPSAPSIDEVTNTDPSDCVSDDGTIVISATAGSSAVEYSIDGGDTWAASGSFTGLGSGTYDVWARNDDGSCWVDIETSTVTLVSPGTPVISDVQKTDITDCGADDGTITINATAGMSPLLFSIDNGLTYLPSETFTDQVENTYNILVANADTTCPVSYSEPIELTAPTAPVVNSVNSTDISDCGLTDGSITIDATGDDVLEYSFTNGSAWFSSNEISTLSPGTYPVVVRNIDGSCQVAYAANPIVIANLEAPVINSVQSNDVSVCNATDGSIIIFSQDGSTSSEFSIDGGTNWSTNDTFTNLSAGLSQVYVRNDNGTCAVPYVLNSVVIANPGAPSVTDVAYTDATGCENTDGTLTIIAEGGMEPLIYSIDGGTSWETSNVFTDLAAGIYPVDVANADTSCLIASPDINIINDGAGVPDVELVNYSVCSDASGTYPLTTANIIINGATSPPTHTILYSSTDGTFADPTDPDTDFTLNSNVPGTYMITVDVKNSNGGCEASDVMSFTLIEQPNNTLSPPTICLEEVADLTINPADQIRWTVLSGDASSLFCGDCPNNSASPDETSKYEVIAINTDGIAYCIDTTDVTILVNEFAPLATLGDGSFFEIEGESCGAEVSICLDANFAQLSDMTIMNNAVVWSDTITACSYKTIRKFDIAYLVDPTFPGPYIMNSWTVNGTVIIGQFSSQNDLVDSMNVWDPSGDWSLDATNNLIIGGLVTGTYLDMNVQSIPASENRTLRVGPIEVPDQIELTLPMGTNVLTFSDNIGGCQDSATVEIIGTLGTYAGELTFDVGSNCDSIIATCVNINPADLINYTITDNGAAYTDFVTGCTLDSLHSYDYTTMPDAGINGPYLLQNWTVNGSIFIGSFSTINDLVDSMNVWDPAANWIIDATDQTIEGGDFQSSTYSGLDILQVLSGSSAVVPTVPFGFASDTGLAFTSGTHDFMIYEDATGCRDQIDFEVSCFIPCPQFFAEESLDIEIDNCDSTHSFAVAIDTAMISNFEIEDNGTAFTGGISGNTDLLLRPGSHTLIIRDLTTFCSDTVVVNVTCPCPTLFSGPELINLDDCADMATICTPIASADISNYTVTNGGTEITDFVACGDSVGIELGAGDHELTFTHNSYGCSEILDVIIECPQPCDGLIAEETMLINTDDCQGPVEVCINVSAADLTDFDLTDNGVPYTMPFDECVPDSEVVLYLGFGVRELVFTNPATGCSDTLTITLGCVGPQTVEATITEGETSTICVDTSELPGAITSFDDACDDSNTGNADFALDSDTYCVEVTANTPGIENACIVTCDVNGLCDTTYLVITITELVTEEPPVANMDVDTILENQTVLLDVIGNDEINGTLESMYIVGQPETGTVIVTSANEIIYTPQTENCGVTTPDVFTYAICNLGGCDTTSVNIHIICDELEVNNGFSPNNDGVNDEFIIGGIEAFPNNELYIFNRWGNLIFRQSGYDNTWRATFEGRDVPDGTYFYIFDEGTGNVRTGYLQILR